MEREMAVAGFAFGRFVRVVDSIYECFCCVMLGICTKSGDFAKETVTRKVTYPF